MNSRFSRVQRMICVLVVGLSITASADPNKNEPPGSDLVPKQSLRLGAKSPFSYTFGVLYTRSLDPRWRLRFASGAESTTDFTTFAQGTTVGLALGVDYSPIPLHAKVRPWVGVGVACDIAGPKRVIDSGSYGIANPRTDRLLHVHGLAGIEAVLPYGVVTQGGLGYGVNQAGNSQVSFFVELGIEY